MVKLRKKEGKIWGVKERGLYYFLEKKNLVKFKYERFLFKYVCLSFFGVDWFDKGRNEYFCLL